MIAQCGGVFSTDPPLITGANCCHPLDETEYAQQEVGSWLPARADCHFWYAAALDWCSAWAIESCSWVVMPLLCTGPAMVRPFTVALIRLWCFVITRLLARQRDEKWAICRCQVSCLMVDWSIRDLESLLHCLNLWLFFVLLPWIFN